MERIADYELVRLLGDGNHGQFFLAVPPKRLSLTAEFVAVKVLAGPTTDDAFRRAGNELRAFASVRSPHLVTLLDAGQAGGTLYYSMEYFPLGSLASPSRPVARTDVLRAVGHAALAAHALHEAGIAHRDIKPANVMLHDDGGKLADLGLAQVLSPGLTLTGMGPIGSIEYIDPAIFQGQRASRSTDIWSLGATLHRALSGKGIYGELPDGDPLLALRRALNTAPTLASSLTREESALVERCFAPVPGDRPATAAEIGENLAALAAA